ncbi:hypothetical protein VTL71DRAFT_9732 [Oculimacula yallundae]|uniref:Opioid growth factor receptor (OGFr) conserved domain-containing protein n=1 Tax=Oculimacula yallundae TaxID=86028 RepID=A0ABR4BRP3_9HELO
MYKYKHYTSLQNTDSRLLRYTGPEQTQASSHYNQNHQSETASLTSSKASASSPPNFTMNSQYPNEKSGFSERGSAQQSTSNAPAYTPFRTAFASLSLHRSDRIRLLSFPQSEIDGIRAVIRQTYTKGLQDEQKYGGSHEFKLYGHPWYGQTSDAITSRVVVREILAYLFSVGWILHASTDVSKKVEDKDTLFFRKQQQPPPASEWVSISFNRSDRLRLIGADEQLRFAFKNLLSEMRLLQEDCGWKDQSLKAWEFKINGYPWLASGEETMRTRLLLMRMLECLECSGWSLYASIDQSSASGNDTSETDTWYCVRERGWVPGSAVFHR